MQHNISVLFYSKISKKGKGNLIPIYLRITINGKRIEQSTHRSVQRSQWSSAFGRMKGHNAEAKSLNHFLDTLKNKVYAFEREMLHDRIEITHESFSAKWFGIKPVIPTVIEVFKQHNDEVALLEGKDYAPLTVKRYETSLRHTQNFIGWKFNLPDIQIDKLNYDFISGYSFYLKSVRNCNHNSTMKYLKNFKKIVLICVKNGWLNKDPFIGFKLNTHELERPFLSQLELDDIAGKQFTAKRLNYVKDVFLFSCYTGLAYVDVQKLKRSEIQTGVDGQKWIYTKRQKTDAPSRIPVLPFAEAIIEKYNDHEQCKILDRVLPVFSNQKMNNYLKEIADSCGITKNLTFHIARHTFATTVTLNNGVSIESVSKMLGHKSIRTTQHYAKILDQKVSEDMTRLKDKLSSKA